MATQTFPDEIIAEVLARLPVKPLLRFKCVSKTWNSFINSPNFIKLHLSKSLISDTNRHLILSSDTLHAADLDADVTAVNFSELNHPFKHATDDDYVTVLGSCNGVVCISDYAKESIFLYNPSTSKTRRIALPPSPNVRKSNIQVFGLGFDSCTDDFKLLRINQLYDDDVVIRSETRVYRLSTGSWKCVDDIMPYSILYQNNHGVLLNEGLHYVAMKDGNRRGKKFIARFDVKSEKFLVFGAPELDDESGMNSVETQPINRKSVFLGALGDSLCVMVNYYCHASRGALNDLIDGRGLVRVDLWVMKEYGKNESWVKLINIREPLSIGCSYQIRPVVYSRDRRRVLLEVDNLWLNWYDLSSKKAERVAVNGGPDASLEIGTFVGSLVSFEEDKVEVKRGTMPLPRKNKKTNDAGNFLSSGFKLRL